MLCRTETRGMPSQPLMHRYFASSPIQYSVVSVINIFCLNFACLYVSLFPTNDAVHVDRKEHTKVYPPRSASRKPRAEML